MTLEEVRKRQLASVGFLLIRAGQLWNEQAIARVNAQAGSPVLREAHTRLLPLLLRPGGARLVDLAQRLGLAKQSVQPLIAQLKALGVVSTIPDDRDGRALRIVLTPEGIDGINQGNEVLRHIERELAIELGRAEMRTLRDLLRRLLVCLEAQEGDSR